MRKSRLGQELIAGLGESISNERGLKQLRATTRLVPKPARPWRKEEIAHLRKSRFHMSQPVFASLLSVTASTVRAWEQGQKSPSGAARRLLELAEREPKMVERVACG